MTPNDSSILQSWAGGMKWLIGTAVGLLAAGGSIVALLEYFDPPKSPSAPVSNPVVVVLVTAENPYASQSNQTNLITTLVYETPVPPKPSPTEFIVSYWQNVSNEKFESSWGQLSPGFRQAVHNGDFSDYVRGLQEMQLCQIVVSNPALVAQSDYSATVSVHLDFQTDSQCNSSEYDFETSLIYDVSTNSWLLDKNIVKQ